MRKARVSKWADDIEGIAPLTPGEVWIITIPKWLRTPRGREKFRLRVRNMVSRYVHELSDFGFRVERGGRVNTVTVTCMQAR